MIATAPFFSVVTPTFNRAHTLCRVWRSLLAQTCRDFEWLIVDDGSTDDTAELVKRWIDDGQLTIVYLRQANAGKHVAFNRAVREARGQLTVPLDSDDECVPNALERFKLHWQAIPDGARDRYASLLCLCKDENGRLLGGALPAATIDGHHFEVTSRLRRSAEMWIALRTDVLRAYPFPEYPGERFVPEGLVWNRIGRRYLSRFINEGLRIYFDSPDSLSRSSIRIRAASPRATLDYYAETMELPIRLPLRLRAAANYWRFAVGAGRLEASLDWAVRSPAMAEMGLLPGLLMALRDRVALRSASPEPTERQVRC